MSAIGLHRLVPLVAMLLLALQSTQAGFAIDGWSEALFSVSDIDITIDDWVEGFGYEVVDRSAVDRGWLDAWGLTRDVAAKQAILRNPGSETGFVRLIQFDGVEHRQMRSNGQTWETGGWFDVNARVVDLDAAFARLQLRGWQGFADPAQLVFGPFVVKEWLARGPDGIVVALIERVQPPLEGWPALKNVSRLFNATQIVADIESSLAFYTETLGFEVYLESEGPSAQEGPNVLGLPHNLTDDVSRHVFIVHPEGRNDGSVELIEFDGFSGRDFRATARPPKLGVMALRFPVRGIQSLSARLSARDVEVVFGPRALPLNETDMRDVLIVRGPNGEQLEFIDASD